MVRGIRGLTVEREAVGRISVPVCSIVGTLDPMRAGVDAMVGVVPDHTVVFVEGADHLQATRSPELARALLEFLRTHSDGTGCKTDLSSGGKARLEAALPPPNIVVVVVDDLRWDEYGAARLHSASG
jgi:hypothetical protein